MKRSRSIPVVLGFVVTVVACASSSSQPPPATHPAGPPGSPPPPDWARAQPQGCGMYLFTQPECEAAFDNGCCAQQLRCASDAGCTKFVQCWNYCENIRLQKKQRGEPGACDCFNNCAPGGTPPPGFPLFENVATCSKQIGYPRTTKCESGC